MLTTNDRSERIAGQFEVNKTDYILFITVINDINETFAKKVIHLKDHFPQNLSSYALISVLTSLIKIHIYKHYICKAMIILMIFI